MFDALLHNSGCDNAGGDDSLSSMHAVFEKMGYTELWSSGWNGWEGDENRRGAVKVWGWQH